MLTSHATPPMLGTDQATLLAQSDVLTKFKAAADIVNSASASQLTADSL